MDANTTAFRHITAQQVLGADGENCSFLDTLETIILLLYKLSVLVTQLMMITFSYGQ